MEMLEPIIKHTTTALKQESKKKRSDVKKKTLTKKVEENVDKKAKINENKEVEVLLDSQNLINEYFLLNSNIKSTYSAKKILQIIEFIYLESLEKFYFRQNKFNYEEVFLECSELPYLYFTQLYGLEKLSKKKFLEFLQSCLNYEKDYKRIDIFCKYFLKISNKKNNFDRQNNHNFVQRNLIIFIQSIKNLDEKSKIILKIDNSEHSNISIINVK